KGHIKRKSQQELKEATSEGLIFPLIKAIQGRTKEIKNHIKLERKDNLLYDVRKRTETILFSMETLSETSRNDFFYFCSEDIYFVNRCKNKSDLEILEFLSEKLLQYKSNLETETN